MAGYCSNCGGSINDGDRVCGNCGTPVGGIVPSMGGAPVQGGMPIGGNGPMMGSGPAQRGQIKAPTLPKINITKENKNKVIGIAAVAVVAIVLLVVIIKLVGGNSGYKGAIKKAIKAIEKEDTDAMIDASSHLLVDYVEDRRDNLDDVYETLADYLLDDMEDDCGNIKSLSFEITDTEEMADRKFNSTLEDLEDDMDLDVDDIKKIVDVEVTIICKGEKKTKEYKNKHFFCVKEDGGWKVIYNYGGSSNIGSAIRYYN